MNKFEKQFNNFEELHRDFKIKGKHFSAHKEHGALDQYSKKSQPRNANKLSTVSIVEQASPKSQKKIQSFFRSQCNKSYLSNFKTCDNTLQNSSSKDISNCKYFNGRNRISKEQNQYREVLNNLYENQDIPANISDEDQ